MVRNRGVEQRLCKQFAIKNLVILTVMEFPRFQY